MKNDCPKNLRLFKPLLTVLTLVLVFAFGVYAAWHTTFDKITDKNFSSKEEVPRANRGNESSEKDVLGTGQYKQYPQISIYGGRSEYSRGGLITFASTDEPIIKVLAHKISGEADVEIYKADEGSLIEYLVHDENDNQLNPLPDPEEKNFKHITSQKMTIVEGYTADNSLYFPVSERGVYFVNLNLNGSKQNAFVLISDVGVAAKEGNNELIFWGQNFETRKSINEGEVKIYSLEGGQRVISSGSFDEDGLAITDMSSDADIAVIHSKEDLIIVPLNLRYLNLDWKAYPRFKPKSKMAKFFIFTDRPLYRPGGKVYYKAIVRDDDDGNYSISSGDIRVRVYDSWKNENPIIDVTKTITEFGAVDGEFSLPEDARTGEYSLVFTMPGYKTGASYWHEAERAVVTFNVQHFRKPEYTLGVETDKNEFIAGDSIKFKISGNYFFGQPLVGQSVNYTIYSGDYYEYAYYGANNSDLSDDYRWGKWWGSKVESGSLTLDSNGEGVVEVKARLPQNQTLSQVYSIEVNADDGSANPAFSRKNIIVYSGEYGIYKKGYKYGGAVGDPYDLNVVLVPRFEADVNGISLKAEIKRNWWEKIVRADKKYPEYKSHVEDVEILSALTDSSGAASFRFVPRQKGSYTFTITGSDSRGNVVTKKLYTWIYEKGQFFYTNQFSRSLTIKAEQELYEPGDTATFTIGSEFPDRDVLLTVERGYVHKYEVLRLSDVTSVYRLPILTKYIPNIYVAVSGFDNYGFYSSSEEVSVSSDSKKMNVVIIPEKGRYGPGDTVSLEIKTTDLDGNALSAETAVWVVDKAIFELIDKKPSKIFETFWSKRGNTTRSAHSLEGITVEGEGGAGGCFSAGTKVRLADGTEKNIEEVGVGDYVLTRKDEYSKSLVKAKVVDTQEHDVSGYLVINDFLRITPEHKLWVNSEWKEAGSIQIGDVLLDSTGNDIKVKSIEWVRGKFKVYNLVIENQHTYFADNVWVHNDKGPTRSIFKDTAYWNPSVVTDSNGKAQVRFKLPDNLTTWVIASIGATKDTVVGQNTEEIVVTKNVVIRPILPNVLRIGDKVYIAAFVQNFAEEKKAFNVSLEFDSGKITTDSERRINLNPNEIDQVYWKIKPDKVNGKSKLIFSTTSLDKELGDEVVAELPVEKFGFWNEWSQAGVNGVEYNIKKSKSIDSDVSNVTLELSSTVTGSVVSAMKYLVNYPYGCVEQTTSKFVPAIVARENLGLFDESLAEKNLDKILNDGIYKLVEAQSGDGGWAWWKHGKTNPYVSAYVFEYLLRARALGYKVDEGTISKATNYFVRIAGTDNDGYNQKRFPVVDKIPAYYALSFLPEERQKLTKLTDIENLSPDLISMAVMHNVRLGYKNPRENGLEYLLKKKEEYGSDVFWRAGPKERFGADDLSTALALKAIIAANGDKDLAASVVRYLMRTRSERYWSNTHATARVVDALIDYSNAVQEWTPNYSYEVFLNGASISSGKVTSASPKVEEIIIPSYDLKGTNILEIKKNGDGQLYSTVFVKEFITDDSAKSVENGMKLTREYINEKGEGYSLGVGDTVIVKLTVEGLIQDDNYLVIEDVLPGGLIPINLIFKNEQQNKNGSEFQSGVFQEIKKNGAVLTAFRAEPGVHSYSYKARVASEGEFIVPPAKASLMYTPGVNARTDVEKIRTYNESVLAPSKVVKDKISKIGDVQKVIVIIIAIVAVIFVFKKQIMAIFNRRLKKDQGSIRKTSSKPPQDQ